MYCICIYIRRNPLRPLQSTLILEVCLRKVWIKAERNQKFTLQEN